MGVAIGAAVAGVPVPLEQVPAPAVKAVKDRFPKAEIQSADKEGKDRFELVMKEGDRRFDVGVTAAGKVLNVKEEIAEEKLPAAVREGLQKKYPGAKIVEAEKITTGEGDKTKVTYELVIKTADGGRNVEFDATGKYIGGTD
jgi:hypothetical protein